MVLFLPFDSGIFEDTSPASGPSRGQGFPTGVWPRFGDAHPNDPPPVELFPMGRPPLTPEQTRRSYARQLGVDPSQIDINGMRLNLDGAAALADPGKMSPGNEMHPADMELAIAHEVQPRYTGTATASEGRAGENGGVLSDSYPPARESQRGQQVVDQEKPGDEGEGKEPKEEPSPDGTTLVTVSGVGGHSALYIRGHGFLYDPGGSFFWQGGRPGDAIFDIDDNGLQQYVQFHERGGDSIEMTKIPTTPTQEAKIIAKAHGLGPDPGGGYCAIYVSKALEGICGISVSRFPALLKWQVEKADCGNPKTN